jgi:catechol 2,3-dioxygenase-like lactoylglutathione lyase family enzyme
MSDSDLRPSVWIGHVVLETDRLEDSAAFMRKLGMRAIFQGSDVAILELRGGTHLVLTRKSSVVPGAAPFDLMVDDLNGAHARFTSLGLAPSAIESIPSVSHELFTIREPAGHVISVYSSHVEGRAV